ncbi:hypothetical protein ZIOFF_040018 [Zingiber officinale]|uniref:Uncharacterized protein n=1 Tax=Zingiber officinale TaxID=94328 RepID=A0A8J5G371_ZINOF|nr:hypothetical protein ZIOFF_040018 [Zingiber officinale]
MVLSALGHMRHVKELAATEKALVTEAQERLVVMCEVVKPKDLVSTEAVRVVAEDLGMNRSKDPALGFQPPRMSIAREKATDKIVALKKTRLPEDDEGVPPTTLREVSLFRMLSIDPHVVRLLDLKQDQNKEGQTILYLVFEYMDTDLKKYIRSFRQSHEMMPPMTVKILMYQLCKGISFCHGHGVLHRDLKPHNLLMDRKTMMLKVADLGLSRAFTIPLKKYTHEMEMSKETNVHSSVHSSQQLPVSVGAKSESRGTIASVENPPQKIPTISSMQSPSVVAVSRFSQPNKLLDHTSIRSEGIVGANASQSSHQMKNQEIKSSTVQAGQGGLHITHQPSQGLAFFHALSLYTNHNEIGKSVQRILQSKVLDHPNWIPPSSDYMNASLNCQICKNVISDIESLLVCDACEKGNHLKCLQSYGSKDIPKAEWHCPSCLASSNGKTLPPKYGRVTRAPIPAPRAAPNTSINVASKKTEDLDPNTSRQKALANNNSYVSQHSNSLNLGGNHYDSMVIGAEMDSRTNRVKRDNEKCDAVGDHLEETNGSVCANSDASCGKFTAALVIHSKTSSLKMKKVQPTRIEKKVLTALPSSSSIELLAFATPAARKSSDVEMERMEEYPEKREELLDSSTGSSLRSQQSRQGNLSEIRMV